MWFIWKFQKNQAAEQEALNDFDLGVDLPVDPEHDQVSDNQWVAIMLALIRNTQETFFVQTHVVVHNESMSQEGANIGLCCYGTFNCPLAWPNRALSRNSPLVGPYSGH